MTDSELQHVSRSLFLVRLGERVEAACLIWRKQNAGIIDEVGWFFFDLKVFFAILPRMNTPSTDVLQFILVFTCSYQKCTHRMPQCSRIHCDKMSSFERCGYAPSRLTLTRESVWQVDYHFRHFPLII